MPLLVLLGVLVLIGVLVKHFPILLWILFFIIFGPFLVVLVITFFDAPGDAPLWDFLKALPELFGMLFSGK